MSCTRSGLTCAVTCWASGESGGDGALSLIGLISLARGLVGEDWRAGPGVSTFFHRVEDADVNMGEGLKTRDFPEALVMGVC